jgi:hypothetical protein
VQVRHPPAHPRRARPEGVHVQEQLCPHVRHGVCKRQHRPVRPIHQCIFDAFGLLYSKTIQSNRRVDPLLFGWVVSLTSRIKLYTSALQTSPLIPTVSTGRNELLTKIHTVSRQASLELNPNCFADDRGQMSCNGHGALFQGDIFSPFYLRFWDPCGPVVLCHIVVIQCSLDGGPRTSDCDHSTHQPVMCIITAFQAITQEFRRLLPGGSRQVTSCRLGGGLDLPKGQMDGWGGGVAPH